MKRRLALIAGLSVFSGVALAAGVDPAAKATNELGLDLFRHLATKGNVCLSPYSISSALAMTLVGADGATRTEMMRVMHLDEKAEVDSSFQALQKSLEQVASKTNDSITLSVANRLFPQSGYQFRPAFMSRVQKFYGAAPEALDFKKDGAGATRRINQWVAESTHDRIRNLIPSPLDAATRLVLANALYLKAPWANDFSEGATQAEPFHLAKAKPVEVPMMRLTKFFGYEQRKDYAAIALPYRGGELQLLVLLPNESKDLAALEKELSADLLSSCKALPSVELDLHFPKFKFEPPTIELGDELRALGMKSAFDVPPGSANFDRMAPRRPDNYLAISDVFHKTFIAVDEHGTEAAAATAVAMMAMTSAVRQSEPIEVKVDRPFVYAIQQVSSGVCLFLGRVTDPR